jgi:hypothetical protein
VSGRSGSTAGGGTLPMAAGSDEVGVALGSSVGAGGCGSLGWSVVVASGDGPSNTACARAVAAPAITNHHTTAAIGRTERMNRPTSQCSVWAPRSHAPAMPRPRGVWGTVWLDKVCGQRNNRTPMCTRIRAGGVVVSALLACVLAIGTAPTAAQAGGTSEARLVLMARPSATGAPPATQPLRFQTTCVRLRPRGRHTGHRARGPSHRRDNGDHARVLGARAFRGPIDRRARSRHGGAPDVGRSPLGRTVVGDRRLRAREHQRGRSADRTRRHHRAPARRTTARAGGNSALYARTLDARHDGQSRIRHWARPAHLAAWRLVRPTQRGLSTVRPAPVCRARRRPSGSCLGPIGHRQFDMVSHRCGPLGQQPRDDSP